MKTACGSQDQGETVVLIVEDWKETGSKVEKEVLERLGLSEMKYF